MRKLLFHIFGSLAIFIFIGTAHAQRPNVIFILTDDMGYGDLSCYGTRNDYKTPKIDKLASQGIKFVNAYSGSAVCSPTRASFMTGRYPPKVPPGLFEPLVPQKRDSAYGLTTEHPSIATRMANAGYETALIGKWHLGFSPQHYPLKNGFQYFFGMISGASDYISHTSDGRVPDLHEMDALVDRKGYLTDILADKAVEFIGKKHEKPFFLTLTFNAPHWPWQGPDDAPYADSVPLRAGGSPELYATMMKKLDDAVGRVMKALDDKQLAANTIVIFTNDNGGERFSNNGGLTDSKLSLWEGGIRVPAFVRWPGKIKAGGVTKQVAITMDWTATILSAAKAKVKKEELDGIDLLPVLTGKKEATERTLYWRATERTLYWRLSQRAHQRAMRDGDWKYIQDEKGEYLFNLAADQAEKDDPKEKNAAVFESLKIQYKQWESQLLTPVPLVQGR
jgi:arylsulfatase A-like enzyme